MFDKKIEDLKEKIIRETCNIINIPSVYIKSDDINRPFGKEVDRALIYTLELGKKLGFTIKNIDGYCGYIEFGEGKEIVGIIGHLDVVPVGDGWNYDPFKANIENGRIYGRGAIDDKGPVIASLYAMKAVMDTVKVQKRVRLILGINEERDWKCIEHYKEKEEIPTIGFSPDADFPCIYAEKGIETIYFTMDYYKYIDKDIVIENIDCRENAINVVPKYCETTLKVNTNKVNKDELISYIIKNIKESNYNMKVIDDSEYKIKLISYGRSAHAAHPDLGENAISKIISLLNKLFNYYNIDVDILNFFEKYIGDEYDGEKLDINIIDESGSLTLNVGDFKLEDDQLKFGINLRIPIKTTFEYVENKFGNYIKDYKNIKMDVKRRQNPLYLDKDNYLVKTLNSIFNKKTGMNEKPIAIGGGTYARAFENCISFGANMPGNVDMCHQANEYIKIDDLILSSKIYAEAIYELAK